MSIATEISRIQTATSDIKTAITGKGVSVPAGSQIDDLPALITSIPAGSSELKTYFVTVDFKGVYSGYAFGMITEPINVQGYSKIIVGFEACTSVEQVYVSAFKNPVFGTSGLTIGGYTTYNWGTNSSPPQTTSLKTKQLEVEVGTATTISLYIGSAGNSYRAPIYARVKSYTLVA